MYEGIPTETYVDLRQENATEVDGSRLLAVKTSLILLKPAKNEMMTAWESNETQKQHQIVDRG